MIRLATAEDIPRMVELGEKFFNGTVLKKVTSYNRESVAYVIEELIVMEYGAAFVLLDDGEIIGGIGGFLMPLYFNHDVTAGQQVFWFVDPAKRSMKSIGLIGAFETWCQEQGASIVWSGAKLDGNYQGMSTMLQRRGYLPLESVFLKGV